ncbi:hypothetical protein FOA52_014811 [Chlamydomonas sp. UWO 241]|nr:hypothetical protein FOA52_014811 [Chlamydomonas sp. UWO 241]
MNNREQVRQHYNQHANQHANFQEAMDNRRKGRAVALKEFHNDIKRIMIKRFASNADALLDLCCGRGGDIIKWFKANVRYVKGVDISEGEVLEASKRFEEQKSKMAYRNAKLFAEFEVCDALGTAEWTDGQEYDVVTCMFAMHYFFEEEEALKVFLHNVALNLKPGGIFMGTIPCGTRVLQLLDKRPVFQSEMLKLERRWQDGALCQPFGLSYTCAISDTVTEGKGDSEGSSEYLSFMEPVERILASHGIFPVRNYDDAELNNCLDPRDPPDASLKHFAPSFLHSPPSLEAASALFGMFVFRKSGAVERPSVLPRDKRMRTDE